MREVWGGPVQILEPKRDLQRPALMGLITMFAVVVFLGLRSGIAEAVAAGVL